MASSMLGKCSATELHPSYRRLGWSSVVVHELNMWEALGLIPQY
jgi:hypothetical protein